LLLLLLEYFLKPLPEINTIFLKQDIFFIFSLFIQFLFLPGQI